MTIQEAAISDPRLKAGRLRMLLYVLHKGRQDYGKTILSDEDIMEDVPGFKEQSTVYRARKQIAELGYFSYVPGLGTRATVYTLSDAPVANVMAKVKRDQERRRSDRKQRKEALVSGEETLQS